MTQPSTRAQSRAQLHEALLLEYANTIIEASDLVAGGCHRRQAKAAMKQLAALERRMQRMGMPPAEVLQRVERYWHNNDIYDRAQWLLTVGQAMFPRRRWSFFFIGWG